MRSEVTQERSGVLLRVAVHLSSRREKVSRTARTVAVNRSSPLANTHIARKLHAEPWDAAGTRTWLGERGTTLP